MVLSDVPGSPTVELVVEAGPIRRLHSLSTFCLLEFWLLDNMVMYSYDPQTVLAFHLTHQLTP